MPANILVDWSRYPRKKYFSEALIEAMTNYLTIEKLALANKERGIKIPLEYEQLKENLNLTTLANALTSIQIPLAERHRLAEILLSESQAESQRASAGLIGEQATSEQYKRKEGVYFSPDRQMMHYYEGKQGGPIAQSDSYDPAMIKDELERLEQKRVLQDRGYLTKIPEGMSEEEYQWRGNNKYLPQEEQQKYDRSNQLQTSSTAGYQKFSEERGEYDNILDNMKKNLKGAQENYNKILKENNIPLTGQALGDFAKFGDYGKALEGFVASMELDAAMLGTKGERAQKFYADIFRESKPTAKDTPYSAKTKFDNANSSIERSRNVTNFMDEANKNGWTKQTADILLSQYNKDWPLTGNKSEDDRNLKKMDMYAQRGIGTKILDNNPSYHK